MKEDFEILGEYCRDKFDQDRKVFLENANKSDDDSWTKHTEFHWSKEVDGKRLDYWPSRKKYQYQGVVRRGDVNRFLMSLSRSHKIN
jgi:hypothetical protein